MLLSSENNLLARLKDNGYGSRRTELMKLIKDEPVWNANDF